MDQCANAILPQSGEEINRFLRWESCALVVASKEVALSPHQAAHTAKRLRALLRMGLLTPHQLVLADCLLWSCRRPGTARACVSYSSLERLTRQARATVVAGIARLVELRVLAKIKQRVRIGWASRQGTNGYTFSPPARTEFTTRPVNREIETQACARGPVDESESALEDALDRLGRCLKVQPGQTTCPSG